MRLSGLLFGVVLLSLIVGLSSAGEPVKVRTSLAGEILDDVFVDVTGTLFARKHSFLSFKVQGVVKEVCVDVGSVVKEGDVLARIDDTDFRLQLRQANAQVKAAQAQLEKLKAGFRAEEVAQAEAALEAVQAQLKEALKGFREEDIKSAEAAVKAANAAFELAKRNRERTEALFKEGAATQQSLDFAVMQEESASAQRDAAEWRLTFLKNGLRAEQIDSIRAQVKSVEQQVGLLKKGFRKEDIDAASAQLELATVALDYAKQQLADTELKAPFDGVIVNRMVDVGVYVVPMMRTTAFEIMDISALDAYLEIPDVYAAEVTVGAKVVLDVDGGEKGIVSSVSAINHRLELPSRKFYVKATIENKNLKMKAGMFVRARIHLLPRTVVFVDRSAVLKDERGEYVMVKEGDVARRRVVKSLKATEKAVLLESGVRAGEIVILDAVGIKDGDSVVEGK